jgi:hypothetical protein
LPTLVTCPLQVLYMATLVTFPLQVLYLPTLVTWPLHIFKHCRYLATPCTVHGQSVQVLGNSEYNLTTPSNWTLQILCHPKYLVIPSTLTLQVVGHFNYLATPGVWPIQVLEHSRYLANLLYLQFGSLWLV